MTLHRPADEDFLDNNAPIKISAVSIAVAVLLIALSLVSKIKFGDIELSGGAPFVGLAGIVILWPLLRQIAGKGGSAEVLGLKLQINAFEKRAEQDFGIKLEELRADLEELRTRAK